MKLDDIHRLCLSHVNDQDGELIGWAREKATDQEVDIMLNQLFSELGVVGTLQEIFLKKPAEDRRQCVVKALEHLTAIMGDATKSFEFVPYVPGDLFDGSSLMNFSKFARNRAVALDTYKLITANDDSGYKYHGGLIELVRFHLAVSYVMFPGVHIHGATDLITKAVTSPSDGVKPLINIWGEIRLMSICNHRSYGHDFSVKHVMDLLDIFDVAPQFKQLVTEDLEFFLSRLVHSSRSIF